MQKRQDTHSLAVQHTFTPWNDKIARVVGQRAQPVMVREFDEIPNYQNIQTFIVINKAQVAAGNNLHKY